ncbi:hypothetical protein AbraIFM66951_005021 [Aspergillus brasiliensis]|uniref:Carbonic anhydrase n=1 Tax=Aspergillus brasiliensis TaxID=319629 RepID=A0A9W6DQ29_9EURO|nr:hypothetical protein AbraCBS73388_009077 [Aspergillus brasiliensis]GKZ43655.1 hypothetical protein AbraIFM66951_005021 [Aspergillus brasiliensis]
MKFFATILSLALGASASCIGHARRADGMVKTNYFNYTATGGPLNWYGLDEDANSACAMGKHQSPIVIDTQGIDYVTPGSLYFNIPKAGPSKLENLGSGLEVVLTNGSLTAGNKTYSLAQFHFHTPSEHRVNNEYYPMEVHFVFQNSHKENAVVGFFFQLSELGYSVPLFDSIFDRVSEIEEPGAFIMTGQMDFSGLAEHLQSHGIYQYTGSLTTPPCSEEVAWYISTQPLPLNVQGYNKVKKVLKYNARYTQNSLGEDNLLTVAANSLQ